MLKKGDVVDIFNVDGNGTPFYEDRAMLLTQIVRGSTPDTEQWKVRFEVDQFVCVRNIIKDLDKRTALFNKYSPQGKNEEDK
ncbi:hypothetical protein LCGC14_0775500 [marine sediment metagenome]|uniref:Uncharacterized protein n=1 Tax=marine sediment metagenome TaxID=412755 RepID=A0A0F9PXD1_9ZZZZ